MSGKKIISFIMVGVLIVMTLVGCGQKKDTVTQDTVTQDTVTEAENSYVGTKDTKFVMVTFLSGIEYWKGCYDGMKAAGEDLGITVDYTGANEYDINQAVTVLEQVIATEPDGILLSCINPDALKKPIQKALDAGIPVITFDADSPLSGRTSFLATSNYAAGMEAARGLAELVGETGEVGLVTLPGQLNHEERVAGFKETIENEYPDMKVVSVQDGKSDQTVAAQCTASMFQANPDIKGIFATDATAGVGVATAVKEANKVGDVKIISFDTDKGTLDCIKDGTVSASIAQGTYNMGYWGTMFLWNIHKDMVPDIVGLPASVDTGVSFVTKENVDSYYRD